MIVVCTQCSMRLQLDDAKVPARPFTVRCPKCQNVINAQPPVNENGHSALANGHSPSTEHPRLERKAAPSLQADAPSEGAIPDAQSSQGDTTGVNTNEVLHMLATLLQRGASGGHKPLEAKRLAWERHRVLVCVGPEHRQALTRQLTEHSYNVFVADSATQAIERMREERMDIIILDPDFDPVEQGGAQVSNEINSLRSAVRRRTFFVHFSATDRTLDQHAAFVNNVNLVVSHADLEQLPRALERGLRDYNDLYRYMNHALNIAAL